MILNYGAKFTYLTRKQGGLCPIAKAKGPGWADPPNELHHRHHRTKAAIKAFPLFIDSVWNLMAVNHAWHLQWPSFGKIGWEEAKRREAFLQRHPDIARELNMMKRYEG